MLHERITIPKNVSTPSSEAAALKVLHVAETVRGGIATYLNELHPHQRMAFGRGNVHYVIPSDHRKDLNGVEDDEISTFRRQDRSVLGLFRMAVTTLQQIRRIQPDIVHIHSTFAGLVLRPLLLLKRNRPRVVYCPHGWAFSRETSQLSHQTTKLVERLLANTSDQIICISSDELREALRAGISIERLVMVNNGISSSRPPLDSTATAWTTPKTKVLFIGRLDRQKGYDLLVDSARKLADVVDVRIIGSSVVGKHEKLDVPANVSLLGWMNRGEIEAQLEKADLVVIPSRWEAFGLVAVEAMRAAKPIVAFRIGALPEIVEDGVTGVLCGPVSAAELTTALQRAATLDLPAMGRRGRDRFRQMYDIEKTHRALNRVYLGLGHHHQTEAERQVAV
ncbi:glycosyltransferase family 4 protein [Bradyrhizobium prioriisuperbiae]|uniref:glycosyltransferase family 4 protein n=1 Tax=Bradyrhizobium prioriisuperbiae TaxID=2854389 RepID=UPI0028E63226|nr:glycosyltransferase family 4 protein [Bradyrhizobium prioritasuperba]